MGRTHRLVYDLFNTSTDKRVFPNSIIDMKVLMVSLDDVKSAKDKFRLIPTLPNDSKL